MSKAASKSEELLLQLNSLESDLAKGLKQIDTDLNELEDKEKTSENYENNLNSLSRQQVEQMEENLDVETQEGEKTLEELQKLLGLEESSVKTLAQVVHHLDSEQEDIDESEKTLDDMLGKLQKEADQGNVDEDLAARCLAEILEIREEIQETAEIEEEASEAAERLGDELGRAHLEFVEMKRDEVNIRSEIRTAEEWAQKNDVGQLEKFLEKEEAPNLERELEELSNELNEEKEDEEEFLEVMQKLAEEGELAEHQIDKLIAEQQTWSAVIKHSLTHGTLSAKKFADAIYGFTPAAIAGKAGAGAAEKIDKKEVMNYLGKLEDKVRDTEKAVDQEAETAVQETETAREKLEKAKNQ